MPPEPEPRRAPASAPALDLAHGSQPRPLAGAARDSGQLNLDQPLRVSSQLVRCIEDGGSVRHAKLRTPVELTEAGWALLGHFEVPASPRQVMERGGLAEGDRGSFIACVSRFIQTGLLVEPDEADYLFRSWSSLSAPHRPDFLKVASHFLGAGRDAGEADFLVAGVPFDRGASSGGAARGPRAIREASLALPAHLDARTGEFRGLWDHQTRRLLLHGARILDRGDVYIEPPRSLAEAHALIERGAEEIVRYGGTPIFLGGDHSISAPILRALVRARGPVFVVHFDAHTDMSPAFAGHAHHHGSVMDVVRRLDGVSGILQVGVRDMGPPWWNGADKTVVLSSEDARRLSPHDLLAHIPEHADCYVSIDIDVLDPSEAPGTGVPVPGGLRLVELERLVTLIGSERRVAAVDLVEVAPQLERANLTAMCAVRVLLRLMDSVFLRSARGVQRALLAKLAR